MKIIKIFPLFLLFLACNRETPPFADTQLHKLASTYLSPLPEDAFEGNKASKSMIDLGEKLFHEKELSINRTKSCSSCHQLENFGVDNEVTSPGVYEQRGTRNTPTVFNAALQLSQFWDGRAENVEEQAALPLLNPIEMGMPNEASVVKRLQDLEAYKPLFTQAFPQQKKPLNFQNIINSIGAFERSLITPSRFDDYLNGDLQALTKQEQKGLLTFIEAGCVPCHSGRGVGGDLYQKFGLFGNYFDQTHSPKQDLGRYKITQSPNDKFVFKVPSLRNIEKTQPYFHDGSAATLEEAVSIMAKAQLNRELSQEELDNIVAFLKTLTAVQKN